MKSMSRLPPLPQQINDYLNGHIIGHYVMKKALSVAIYNHYSNILISKSFVGSRKSSSSVSRDNLEESLIEDTRYVFNRVTGLSSARMVAGQSCSRKVSATAPPRYLSEFHDYPELSLQREYMTPIVSRVMIEASSHRVHLRKSNTLTFDSTGSSKPLAGIASTVAQYLDVPYVICDCSYLNPVHHINSDRREPKDGTLAQLLSGYCGETINSVISRLYRKADFDLDKASRSIVFLDGMHKIGENQGLTRLEQQQVLREILQIIEGTHTVDVSRAGSESNDSEVLDTSNMFFICFGVFEAEEQLMNYEDDDSDIEVLEEEEEIEEEYDDLFRPNDSNNNKSTEFSDERRDSRTSDISMETVNSSGTSSVQSSNSSNEKSPQGLKKIDGGTTSQAKLPPLPLPPPNPNPKQNEQKTNKKQHVISSESDFSSMASSQDEWEDWEDGDSFQPHRENKLARLLNETESSPIPHYKMLWGMKDVDLKFTPEALEIIANQALSQQAGKDGVTTILEKLFLTVKFDILGKDVVEVEITEDFVLGKSRPNYRFSRKKSSNKLYRTQVGMSAIQEEVSPSLTDYDQGIFEQLEI